MKKINVAVMPTESEKSIRIVLEGEWTLKQAGAIKEELTSHITTYESIDIVLQHVTNLDLTGIQLLYALRQSAIETSKQCQFQIIISHELEQLLNHTGFAHLATQLSYITPN